MKKFLTKFKDIFVKIFTPPPSLSMREQNEIKANRYLAWCLFIFALLFVLLYIGLIYGFFTYIPKESRSVFIIMLPFVFLAFVLPSIWAAATGVRSKVYKIIVLSLVLFAISLCYTITSKHFVLIWCLPLIFVMHYYSPKVSLIFFIATLFCMIATTYTSMFFGEWDSNIMNEHYDVLADNTILARIRYINTLSANGDNRYLMAFLIFTLPNMVIITIEYIACNALARSAAKLTHEVEHNAIEKERLESEFQVANRIQYNVLPTNFPTDSRIDLYALMDPAKQVGGDFYDFYYVDQTHIAFLVADTSGKGIPAAMFMMSAKTLFHSFISFDKKLSNAIEHVNKQLCLNNPEMMFVTAWIGVLNIESGKLHYVNAGHNYPIIKRKSGKCEYLKNKPDCFLGAREDINLSLHTEMLNDGDQLLLYTDGITEAENINNKFFGDKALLKFMENDTSFRSKDTSNNLLKHIFNFSKGVEQSDDITILSLIYHKDEADTITVPSQIDNLVKVSSFIEETLFKYSIPTDITSNFSIAIDEIFSNIVKFAYSPNIGDVTISLFHINKEYVRLTIIDRGRAFNPLLKDNPDLSQYKENNKIGGLGIYIVKKLMDDVSYNYQDGQNVLTLIKKI